jgi:hypothetical protein
VVWNSWIIIGLFVGALARLAVPGQKPIRWLTTTAISIAGAVIGGLAGSAAWPIPEHAPPPAVERVECVTIPDTWELIEVAVWPASAEGPGASDLWPEWVTAMTTAILVLRTYFLLARGRPTPIDTGA